MKCRVGDDVVRCRAGDSSGGMVIVRNSERDDLTANDFIA